MLQADFMGNLPVCETAASRQTGLLRARKKRVVEKSNIKNSNN